MISPAGMYLLSFDGTTAPGEVLDTIARRPVAGVTLFRDFNFASAAQISDLTAELQAANQHPSPLIVATDQETGQFMALGDATPFAGNMALGAADDPDLTRRVAAAIGMELRALGINVDYAPAADINTNPSNPSVGIRSFGDDATSVARHVASFVDGIQSTGVAATVKHFPGAGDAATDPHHELPLVPHDRERLDAVELVPFRAAIDAGARLVMASHIAVPAITGSEALPTTLAPEILDGLLRRELGFEGPVVSDALDMKAITQGSAQIVDVIAAVAAGVDLLLMTAVGDLQARITEGLDLAVARRLIRPQRIRQSVERSAAVRAWLGGFESLETAMVGIPAHVELARELAERSITLVRDHEAVLPLRTTDGPLLAVQPQPTSLTPADTSPFESPGLGDALRRHHPAIDEVVVPHRPDPAAIAAIADRAAASDAVIVGTVAASSEPAQADLVRAVLATGTPCVTVSMRTPYDVGAYPEAPTNLATYSISRHSLDAAADVIFGESKARGRLPVAIADLYERGHGA